MHIVTMLNRIEKHNGFVFGEARWAEGKGEACIEIPYPFKTVAGNVASC